MKTILIACLAFICGASTEFSQNTPTWQDYLEIKKPNFKQKKQDRRLQIQYMPNFKNLSGKHIVAIKFSTDFKDEAGNVIHETGGTLKQKIKSMRASKNKEFDVFVDNQFLTDDTHDILLPLLKSKRSSQVVTVSRIEFEDGEVLEF